jgi:hypothetical protein
MTNWAQRFRDLREAGLDPDLAHEAVAEERAVERRSMSNREEIIGVHRGRGYTQRHIDEADAGALDDPDTVFVAPDRSPIKAKWDREEAERVRQREQTARQQAAEEAEIEAAAQREAAIEARKREILGDA